MTQLLLSLNADGESEKNLISIKICVNKEYELTENIAPKWDIWKFAEWNANEKLNALRNKIRSVFTFKKSFNLLFTNVQWEWKVYSYQATKAKIEIEDDDDLETAIDIMESNEDKCLKLRIVFNRKTLLTYENAQTESTTSNAPTNESPTIPCDQCGQEVAFSEYQDHQLAHMISSPYISAATLLQNDENKQNISLQQFEQEKENTIDTELFVMDNAITQSTTQLAIATAFEEEDGFDLAELQKAMTLSMSVEDQNVAVNNENKENQSQNITNASTTPELLLKSKKGTVKRPTKKELDLSCFCGETFRRINAKNAYNGRTVLCNACENVCKYRIFHCPAGKIDVHPHGADICQNCASQLKNQEQKYGDNEDLIPVKFKDPITKKIMKNPTMIVSSAQVYDEITIEKMMELQLRYDVLTGIPFSINGWPLLLERRVDIKDEIELFLKEHSSFKTQVIDEDDKKNITFRLLFEKHKCKTKLENKATEIIQDQENLTHTAKQIFKPLRDEDQKESHLHMDKKAEKNLLMMKAKWLHDNLDIKDRRWFFTIYQDCFLGSEAVKVIMNLGFANDKQNAIEFGNKLMKHNIIVHVTNDETFKNQRLYYKFVADFSKASDEKEQIAGIKYDDTIILDPDIPVVCIMGPSRNGKSTIVNDILGVKACQVSSSSNVALTKGAWITKYSTNRANETNIFSMDELDNKDNDVNVDAFYLLDLEGLSHNVTKFTKQLFYACYAVSNVIIWNDKNVASDDFKNLMSALKKEMAAVANSDNKPSFLYLERDAGDYNYNPYNSLEEYINNDESFKWFRKMNIFSSLSAYELQRPSIHKNNKKGELNFHSTENRALLKPLIAKIIDLCTSSNRFACDRFELKKQIDHINESTVFNLTEMSIANNEILQLFSLSSNESFRRCEMIYVACEFNWDHNELQKRFAKEMNKMKSVLNGINKIDYKMLQVLEKNKKEIYQRVKNKKLTSYKEVAAKTASYGGLALYVGGGVAFSVATAGLGAALVVMCAGGFAVVGGRRWIQKNKGVTRPEVVKFATRGYLEYSLGKTDEEIELTN